MWFALVCFGLVECHLLSSLHDTYAIAPIRDCGDVELQHYVVLLDSETFAHTYRPVWLLLPRVPDWRWFLEGPDTPWYPSMRLFRQTGDRDWRPVIERVKAELSELRRDPARASRP